MWSANIAKTGRGGGKGRTRKGVVDVASLRHEDRISSALMSSGYYGVKILPGKEDGGVSWGRGKKGSLWALV